MYNYYTDLKLRKKLEEEKKEAERKKRRKKIREKKMMEYTKNYENRIKNFIYNMAEKPIHIRENPKPFSTTREEYLTEESDKILFHKGFIFNLYQTDKDRVNAYQNEREKYEEYMNSLLTHPHNKHLIRENSNINHIDYTQSFSQDKIYNKYINKNNNNNSNNNINEPLYLKITQPEMRFKPRSDLERIYNVLQENQPNNLKTLGNRSKKVVEKHLHKMGFKAKIEEHGKSPEELIEENRFKSIEELINENRKDINKNKNNQEKKKFDLVSKVKNKKVDNSKAKALYPDLYNKTYFNAVENYSLFKNSCFLPNKFNFGFKNNSNGNFKIFNKTIQNDNNKIKKIKIIEHKRKKTDNDIFLDDNNNYSLNNKKGINTSSPGDLVNFLNNCRSPSLKEENLMKSLDNIDLFTQGLRENRHKLTKKEKVNFDIIKSMAFEKKKKRNYIPIQIESKTEVPKVSNFNDFNTDDEDNDTMEDYNMKKTEEKIKIDGIEYSKNDLENLSKAVMNKCKFTRKKYRSSDSDFSKTGRGKLMFTNGLTVSEFEKKYHIHG